MSLPEGRRDAKCPGRGRTWCRHMLLAASLLWSGGSTTSRMETWLSRTRPAGTNMHRFGLINYRQCNGQTFCLWQLEWASQISSLQVEPVGNIMNLLSGSFSLLSQFKPVSVPPFFPHRTLNGPVIFQPAKKQIRVEIFKMDVQDFRFDISAIQEPC